MRTASTILTIVILLGLAGCKSGGAQKPARLEEGKELLTVDFQEGRALQYKFVCSRDVAVDWDPEGTSTRSGRRANDAMKETMEMTVSYTPVEVDPYGVTTVEANIQSVRVTRTGRSGSRSQKDAVEYLSGKTFKIGIGPTGKIEDTGELDALIKEIGTKAFREDPRQGRIKEPDMIGDFVVTQWFLWDSISSVENPSDGVSEGQSWTSQLSVPAPMVMRKARDVTYTLKEIRTDPQGRLAVIASAHKPAESAPHSWPIPYSGRFMMAGTFGFLSGYKLLEMEGDGEELFNISAGRTEQYNHQYRMKLQASIPLGIDAKPLITINQNISMTRLGR